MERLLHQEGRVEVQCRFCGEQYLFGAGDVDALFADAPQVS
jgi:redox-regulated HSP33 family molecular chaperone